MKVYVKIEEGNPSVILDIIFTKTHPGERRHFGKKELIDTTCIIFRIGGVAQGITIEIARGIARQNPLDNYNKIVGKKVALAKAIAQIEFLKRMPKSMITYHRRHEMRRHIWEVFHQTFGRWS